MTRARKPAGAPDGWREREPAGAPDGRAEETPEDADGTKVPDSATNAPSEAGEAPDSESAAAVEGDLDALLVDVKRERDEYLEIAQRARADFENYRKRAAREVEEAERRGKVALARELVPALDNLERALRAAGIDPTSPPAGSSRATSGAAGSGEGGAQDAPSEEVSAHEALARGVALVYGELRAALERAGVETYDPTGEQFDPNLHEALATRPSEDQAGSGVVIETLEKGYRLDGQVLRAARVVVSE